MVKGSFCELFSPCWIKAIKASKSLLLTMDQPIRPWRLSRKLRHTMHEYAPVVGLSRASLPRGIRELHRREVNSLHRSTPTIFGTRTSFSFNGKPYAKRARGP